MRLTNFKKVAFEMPFSNIWQPYLRSSCSTKGGAEPIGFYDVPSNSPIFHFRQERGSFRRCYSVCNV